MDNRVTNTPLVSIVIPTYNSEKTIVSCLKSIVEQTYSNIEVVVVDRNSLDSTAEIAERFKAKVFNLDAERTEAKNYGLEKTRGKYVCFIEPKFI